VQRQNSSRPGSQPQSSRYSSRINPAPTASAPKISTQRSSSQRTRPSGGSGRRVVGGSRPRQS
jgi:hypothetical protein